MIDQLRLFLNRPLSDTGRPRLFALAVTLIAGTALVLARLDDAGPARERTTARAATATPADPPAAPTPSPMPAPTPTPTPLTEEGAPVAGEQPSHADVADAKHAARRFLAGYLPYTYARGHARDLQAVTALLRRRLAHDRPRVPAAERDRHPRLVLVQSDAVSRARARLIALVRDGRRRYSVALVLTQAHGVWRVARVGG